MLTCQEVLDYLSDYLEGRLPEPERARLDEHLAVCPPCIAYLANFRATIDACRTACRDESDAPPPVPDELVRAILAARGR